MTAVSVKIKKPNWTEAEVLCLVDNVTAADIVDNKFSSHVTAYAKHRFWDDVEERINSICVCIRTQEEIKKKWADLKATVVGIDGGYDSFQITGNLADFQNKSGKL